MATYTTEEIARFRAQTGTTQRLPLTTHTRRSSMRTYLLVALIAAAGGLATLARAAEPGPDYSTHLPLPTPARTCTTTCIGSVCTTSCY